MKNDDFEQMKSLIAQFSLNEVIIKLWNRRHTRNTISIFKIILFLIQGMWKKMI